jgi:hypothetical protein
LLRVNICQVTDDLQSNISNKCAVVLATEMHCTGLNNNRENGKQDRNSKKTSEAERDDEPVFPENSHD